MCAHVRNTPLKLITLLARACAVVCGRVTGRQQPWFGVGEWGGLTQPGRRKHHQRLLPGQQPRIQPALRGLLVPAAGAVRAREGGAGDVCC